MSKQAITTDQAPRPSGAYSQAITAGALIFVSGQGPFDPQTGVVTGATIEAQTAQTLDNIAAILAATGATLDDVVRVTAHLSDLSLFEQYNEVYSSYFPHPQPARTTVGSHLPGILIEMDVIAYREPTQG